jgi:DNA-binding transcriptional MerR regulator
MYTLADLTRLCGAKRRTIQLWAEAAALVAEAATERQGSGTHRMFSRDEAIICLILSRFARWNISVGQLVRIGTIMRKYVLTSQTQRDRIEKAIRGGETLRMTLDSANTVTLLTGYGEKGAPRKISPTFEIAAR